MNTTKQLEKARELQTEFAARLDKIRQDGNLSDEGRRSQVAAAYLAAKPRFDDLRAQEERELGERYARLEDRVFGEGLKGSTSYDVIAYRDAQDRAAQARNQAEATAMLERAEASRDAQLSTAIARRAVERDWEETFERWLDKRSHLRQHVEELADIENYISPGNRVARAFALRLAVPQEIAGIALDTAKLERIAGQQVSA